MLAEIAYFETQADAVDPCRSQEKRELRSTFLTFARRRRQLLAAIRAGHPEDWRCY